MTKQDLLALKENITTAKGEVAKLQGKLEHLMGELKTQYKCKTVEEAKKKSAELSQQIENLKESINAATAEMEEKYDIH